MKKKLTVMIMTLALLFTTAVLDTDSVNAANVSISGKDCTSNSYAAATIDYIVEKYPLWSTWTGPSQCMGFAMELNELLGSKTKIIDKRLKWNKKNIKKYLVGVKAGTHVRFENTQWGFSHSIVILKCTKKRVIWADANYDYNNGIRYTDESFDSFVSWRANGDTYITRIEKVTRYKKFKAPRLLSTTKKYKVKLRWTKVRNAVSYKVMRSKDKNGRYKMLAKTDKLTFTDKSGKTGEKYYYKVIAVKGDTTTASRIVSGIRQLPAPGRVRAVNDSSGRIKIKWKSVKDADRYRVYRYSKKKGRYELLTTTSETRFTDKAKTKHGKKYKYMVKAYMSNKDLKSKGVVVYGKVL